MKKKLVAAAVILLALGWVTANIRPIPADEQAVILRFGRALRVQPSGLVLALPPPMDRIVLLPSAARESRLTIASPATAGLTLTSEAGVILLNAELTWRIDNAASYANNEDQIPPALDNLFHTAAIHRAASLTLNTLIAAGPALGADIAADMNRALQSLAMSGAPLGVSVTRADVTATMPVSAQSGIDAVTAATQHAAETLAIARADAAHARQKAETSRDTILTTAHASAAERIATARAATATITALEVHPDARTHANLLVQLYQDRIGAILAQAGSVSTVDAKAVSHLILPGAP